MQEQNYSIKEWAKADRPREKLRSGGPSHLSDSELLAILLRNGVRKKSALDLAKQILLLGKNDLSRVAKLSLQDLMKVPGVGEAKAATITAALELGRRRETCVPIENMIVRSSREIATFIRSLLRDLNNEAFGVVFLNQANKIQHHEIISTGGITGTVADPRIIFRKALSEYAVALILFHNHPSGNLKPSRADEELTSRISQAAKLFDIRVLDHLIVSEEGYFSFADEGLM